MERDAPWLGCGGCGHPSVRAGELEDTKHHVSGVDKAPAGRQRETYGSARMVEQLWRERGSGQIEGTDRTAALAGVCAPMV